MGYKDEMEKIKKAAELKGVVLESILSLDEFIELKNNIDD